MTRIKGHQTAMKHVLIQYNVEKKNLAACTAVSGGKRSPTINPLSDPNWVAVSVLVGKKEYLDVMDQISAIGATDIIVTALKSCRV